MTKAVNKPSNVKFDPDKNNSFDADDEDKYIRRQRDAELHSEKLKGISQDREERKKYAKLIFFLVAGWFTVVLVLMYLIAFSRCRLSDKVIITLLGTTTANMATFLFLVTKYLFSRTSK